MARLATMPLLILLVAASWTIPAWQTAMLGSASIVSLVTASMFTAMLIVYPFLNRHPKEGRLASMCRDCRSPRWPNDLALGFCIGCGSTRPPVPLTL